MPRATRLLTVSSLIVALGLAGSLVPAPAARATGATGQPAEAPAETIEWAPCDADPSAECGTLRVPIDWNQPGGPEVELALARRPATDPAARVGMLFVMPGGPGGSGVDFVRTAPGYFSAELRSRFDLVGFDPRGVARSHPVVCSAELVEQLPSPLVTSEAEFDAMLAINARLGADCRARTGPLFDHVDTLSVIRDLDALRAALGEDQLSYYGRSYGTLIGQQYAEAFPHRVRAMVLDSNMDHSLDTRAFLDTQARSVQGVFDEFVAWCDGEPRCALHGKDIRDLWAELLDRAERGELGEVTVQDLIGFIFGFSFGPFWFELADTLRALADGAPAPAAAVGVAQENEVVLNPTQAVFCSDWDLSVRGFREYRRHLQRMARIAPDVRYGPNGLFSVALCADWPSELRNPQHRLRVPPGPELLLTGAQFDPATPYRWTTSTFRQLRGRAALLTYDGWGHGVYPRSDCLSGASDDFLISLTRPARGASCPAVPPEPPAAGSQAVPSPPQPHVPRPDLPPRW